MSFEVKNETIETLLRDIGKKIAAALPKGWGFNLLIFDFSAKEKGESTGSMFYMSNAKREDMIEAMKEFIEKQEKKA